MSTMTLAEARIKLNMPFASDAEVRSAAQRSNIQIIDLNLNGFKNTANLSDLNNNLGGSLFGASTASQAGSSESLFGSGTSISQPSLALSMSGSGSNIYGDMGVSFTGVKDSALVLSDEISHASVRKDGNIGDSIPQVSLNDVLKNQNLGEIRVVNGKLVAFDKNGKELIGADGSPLNIDASDLNEGISSVKYIEVRGKNGKIHTELIIEHSDGRTTQRRARAGESGFSEKGENFDQRLQRYFGLSTEQYAQLSDDEKKQYSLRYQKGIRDAAYEHAIKKGKSKQEAAQIAKNAVISDFRALCRRSGKSPEEMKGIAITLYGLDPEVAEREVKKYCDESITKSDVSTFASGVVDNVHLADNPKLQASVVSGAAEAAKVAGVSSEVATSIGNAIVENKFHGRDATIEALRTQYGLSAEQANKYYASLPEEVRQKIEDETLDAISTVQTEVAADETQPEDVRHEAADLSTEYITYIDDAEYQMQVIQNNSDYIMQNADEEMQQYYNNSIASNAYNYDISNREDVIRMVKELGTEKTLEILDNARKEYEAQDADNKAATALLEEAKEQRSQAEPAQSNVQTPQKKTQQTKQNISTRPSTHQISGEEQKSFATSRFAAPRSYTGLTPVQTYVMSDEFKSADMRTKQDYINKLNVSDKKQAVAALVETATPAQLTAYMYSGLKKNILSYLVNHPGGKNTETLKYLSGFLSGPDKEFVKQLEEERNKLLGIKNTSSNVDFTQQRKNPFNFEA